MAKSVSRQGISRQGIMTDRPNSCMSCPSLHQCTTVEWALQNCGLNDQEQIRDEEGPRERPPFATVVYFPPTVAQVAAANVRGGYEADVEESIERFEAQLAEAAHEPIRVQHLTQSDAIRISTPSGCPRDELRIFDTFTDLLATPDRWLVARPQLGAW